MAINKVKLKQNSFAPAYVKNGFNGSKTAKEVWGIKNDATARKEACKILSKPDTQRQIAEVMKEQGLDSAFITKVTKRNIKQSKNYAASNSAIDMWHRLEGNYAPEKHANMNINIPVDIDGAVKDLLQELEMLK